MLITREVLEKNKLLQNLGWVEKETCASPTLRSKILKHPSKDLYYFEGIFGKNYSVRLNRRAIITHRYHEMPYYKEYEFDQINGTLTRDDIICINLK